MIPTTVPHSGLESFEGTAPLYLDGAMSTMPDNGDVPSDPGCNAVAVLPGFGDG